MNSIKTDTRIEHSSSTKHTTVYIPTYPLYFVYLTLPSIRSFYHQWSTTGYCSAFSPVVYHWLLECFVRTGYMYIYVGMSQKKCHKTGVILKKLSE